MYSIKAQNLHYQFPNGDVALDHISLHIKEGSIYGFLGPNGAGKTTTLRLLLGLLRKQHGSIQFFGKEFVKHRIELLQKIGSLIESPSLYSHLTATENLLIWQRLYRCPTNRIAEVLYLVGLGDTGRKKAGQFSLGMKQRLALAVALLHSPQLLILDEPTNGLDPHGMVEMRELLKTLNQQHGITILVSSHLLSEIEKLVTDIGIIHKGQMKFEGSLQSLLQKQREASSLVFEVNDAHKAKVLIESQYDSVRAESDRVLLPMLSKAETSHLNQVLVNEGVEVYGIHVMQYDLESIFMNITA